MIFKVYKTSGKPINDMPMLQNHRVGSFGDNEYDLEVNNLEALILMVEHKNCIVLENMGELTIEIVDQKRE